MLEDQKERVISLEEFFVGNGVTCLSPKELLVEVLLPEPAGVTGSAFIKVARVAADLAKISIAVRVVRNKMLCQDCGIAMGGVAKTPMRLRKADEVLKGMKVDSTLLEKAGQVAAEEIQPGSRRSTSFYKKEVTKILIRDALTLAWERAIKDQ